MRSAFFRASVLIIGASASAACGNDIHVTGTGGTAGAPPTTSSADGSSSSTGGSTTPCGSVPCGADEFCDYPDDLCGKGAAGTCKPRPAACDKDLQPTCGCDGSIHGNPCEANASGVDANDGGCPASATPSGSIACGAHFCNAATDYCEASFSDVGGEPSSFACKPLPASCMAPSADCACFPPETPCVSLCKPVQGTGAQSFELDCPGG